MRLTPKLNRSAAARLWSEGIDFRLCGFAGRNEEALIEVGRSLSIEARAAVAARMRDIVAQGSDGVYAASRGGVADRIAASLIAPDQNPNFRMRVAPPALF